MKLHSAVALAAALLLLPLAALAAEDQAPAKADPPSSSPEVSDLPVNPFLQGEQTIGLSAGLYIPAFILPKTGGGADNLDLGGAFSFSYQYFIARGFAIGGNLAGAFNNTIGDNTVFTAPLGLTAAYWWAKSSFEFDVFTELGAYLMRYDSHGIMDPFAKAGAGTYWRINPSWSLGLQASFWFVPEIHYGDYTSLSQYGGFVETAVSAVYHL
jgi:hypothetical protein